MEPKPYSKRNRRPPVPEALSTGQAAQYCLVTPDTIVNWIKRDKLPAQRTLGGQFRILVRDLRDFMLAQGMDTELLNDTFNIRHYCWEHRGDPEGEPLMGGSCEDCLVRRSHALNCFELRSALSTQADDLDICVRCRYLSRLRLGEATPNSAASYSDEQRDPYLEYREGDR